jgi:hypothetical protein
MPVKRLATATVTAMALLASAENFAQDPSPRCDELVWSAQVLAANPDIQKSCQGVYERNNELYAKVTIEVIRVRGNRITFRPEHTDGSTGAPRTITVNQSWRANIAGRNYRASELLPGQELNVFIPEDRFALAIDDGTFDGDQEMYLIEDAAVVAMPKTASPLYTMIGVGLSCIGLGGIMSYRRRLRAR